MDTRNSTGPTRVDTTLHRCTAMEEDTMYPLLTFPAPRRTTEEDTYRARALRWILVIDLVALAAFAKLIDWARG